DLIDAITSQQLSGKAAKTIFNRVKESLSGKITPEAVLTKKDQQLRDCGLSWAKVKYIKDLADRVKKGVLKINELDSLSDEEVVTELVAVKGIGRWTAEMFLMFSLGRADSFPVDDLGIKKGFEKVTGKKWNRVKSAKFAEKNWAPYRTVASWYLWRSLENR
ncbi:MAG: DNA-3-methyladenine glycosylase family protein, partial [Microgenomates group bacterium]